MIITRTPFRVTLGGGGTDLPSFYEKHGGFIFAMGINKYMYVSVNPPVVDTKIRLHYTESEVVDHVSEVRHELVREALKLHGIENRMEISSMADLPAGTGVGSSSSYLVGLLAGLHQYRRDHVSLDALAEEACDIELNILKKNIGKQDQYMAAFGGLTVLDIAPNGKVTTRSVCLRGGAVDDFVRQTHIYYTGQVRDAQSVLRDQDRAMKTSGHVRKNVVENSLSGIKELGHRILEAIESENLDTWGQLLHEHWMNKKRLSNKVSNEWIDELYEEVRSRFGVLGGKIIGAGGGGFLMLYMPGQSGKLEEFMRERGLPRMYYDIEPEGVKVVGNFGTNQLSMYPTMHTRRAQLAVVS